MKSPDLGEPGAMNAHTTVQSAGLPHGSFQRALRGAEETYESLTLPAMADARLRWKLGQLRTPRQARSAWRYWAFAGAGLATAAALLLYFGGGEREAPPADAGGPVAELLPGPIAYLSAGGSVTATAGGGVLLGRGSAALASHGFDGIVDTADRAELRHEPEGVRLVRGRVTIAVRKLARSAPVRVFVSHGVVEVLGTRFELTQDEAGGEVKLFEGIVRFSDGATARTLTPGQSLRWPQVADVAPAKPAAQPGPDAARQAPSGADQTPLSRKSTESAISAKSHKRTSSNTPRKTREAEGSALAAVLDTVASLRTRGEYDDAAAALRKALSGRWRAATRERLSFELGSILGDHLGDRGSACEYWRRHEQRFAGGRYHDEVQSALVRLGCTSP